MLRTVRYYFELISIPVFIFLSFNLSLEAVEKLLEIPDTNSQITLQTAIISIFFLLLFVWIWHLPHFKKWVPCIHEHCHNEQNFSHIMASIALCLHFFPEAEIRHQLLFNNQEFDNHDIITLIGFASHFAVDIIVMIFISSYWQNPIKIIISVCCISIVWFLALLLAIQSEQYPDFFEATWALLASSFLLAMFIHKPHKAIVHCHDCD